jgi:hypothetical protein
MGWQNFLLATLYLPAVAMVVWPMLKKQMEQWMTLLAPRERKVGSAQ